MRRIKADYEKQQDKTRDRQVKVLPGSFKQVYRYVDDDDSSSGEQIIKCSFRKGGD